MWWEQQETQSEGAEDGQNCHLPGSDFPEEDEQRGWLPGRESVPRRLRRTLGWQHRMWNPTSARLVKRRQV